MKKTLDSVNVGDAVKATDLFNAGETLDVTGTVKVVLYQRYGGAISVVPATHGVHEYYRHGGSIGMCAWPAASLKTKDARRRQCSHNPKCGLSMSAVSMALYSSPMDPGKKWSRDSESASEENTRTLSTGKRSGARPLRALHHPQAASRCPMALAAKCSDLNHWRLR